MCSFVSERPKESHAPQGEAQSRLFGDRAPGPTMLNDESSLVYVVLELAIAVLAVLGNALVCWAVSLNSNLQNVTNFFVVSLAAADIAVGVLAIPFAIAISTGFCAYFFGCLFIACFVLVLTQSSIFSLLAIAMDRYIAIKMPLRYNSLVTGNRAKGIIAVCWVLSVVIGLTPMLGWNKGARSTNSSCPRGMMACLFEEVVSMDYMVYFNFFGCVLVPLILMLGIYLRIFMAARRQLKRINLKGAGSHGEKSGSTLQKEVHAAKSLAIIVGLFAICWLPLHFINCFTHFCPGCARPHPSILYLAIVLSHANSVVNPLIYAYRIREFRHTFRRIIRHHVLGRRQSHGGSQGSGRSTNWHTSSWQTSTNLNTRDPSASQGNGFALDSNAEPGSNPCLSHVEPKEAMLTLSPWKPCGVPGSPMIGVPHATQLSELPCVAGQPVQRGVTPSTPKGLGITDMMDTDGTSSVHAKLPLCRWTPRCPALTQVS
ncbi:adenosine receptor A2a-like [Scleropages formosus]|uniref:Adenosine receptor A2 n=1 Tax=Scleropages formosus TaxID=113540 RepID=A0A0P7Y9H4_SCLFO|nr:adenosine receptor A2b-like [Scleropages formosus]XP_018604785.1 adenosine receptor A2b-like [Scleropages formosus]XP_018604793.1 adenosine receptor A2b-like [Scleropages formosus]KPP62531.1 adenosine receptor A2a-like [Scleropages formosus]